MKKKLLYGCALVFMVFGFNSCEESCKTCKQVTYINGVYNNEGAANEYCGASLIGIEAAPDVVIGTSRTTWECN
jgi:hypothetical protein